MIVDPVAALANVPSVLKHTSTSVVPVPTISPTGAPIPQVAGESGKRALWVVFVIMLVATIAFSIMSFSVPISKRLYHFVTTLIVLFATIAYFAMACGDGISWHYFDVKHHPKHGHAFKQASKRQVYWARYVDWSLTTPLLLLDLCLLAGLNGAHILMVIVADLVMVLTGLFAAYGKEGTPSKWGYYAIACIAYLVIVWHLAFHGRAMAMAKGGKVGGFFAAIGGFTLLLWTAYPIVWGIADGARIASVDQEILAYAVLDVLAKPVFGLWLLLTHANLPETNIELGGFWSNGLSSEGTIRVGDDDDGA